jgi:hypothetical protein
MAQVAHLQPNGWLPSIFCLKHAVNMAATPALGLWARASHSAFLLPAH